MSYCRWSSDGGRSDVYVYQDVNGGWTTMVAELKFVDPDNSEATIPIGLEYDGAIFNDLTPNACADRLESLRGMGYVVPQYAIDALREESKED